LREAPYAFASTLEDWEGERDLEERWRARLTEVPFNVIARLNDVPVGMASGTAPNHDGAVELISMWVAPSARGNGVGKALVASVVTWARSQEIERLSLDVREDNTSAIAFYEQCGFVDEGRIDRPGPPERRMIFKPEAARLGETAHA
jgi:ribosomal protein S18 acetylase RimI-like enzyme